MADENKKTTTEKKSPEKKTPAKVAREKSWFSHLLGLAITLAFLTALTIQIVLWTNVPKNLVIDTVASKLGVELAVTDFSTGWSGLTVLEGAQLTVPLVDEPMIQADKVVIEHASLPGLIVGGGIGLDRIQVNNAVITLHQQADGGWDIEYLMARLAAMGGGEKKKSSSGAVWPLIEIPEAKVSCVYQDGHRLDIEPVTLQAENDGKLIWRFDLSAGQGKQLTGDVVTQGRLEHHLTFSAEGLEAWLERIYDSKAGAINLKGQWDGRMENGHLTGDLTVEQLDVAGVTAEGKLHVLLQSGIVELTPEEVLVKQNSSEQTLLVKSGTVFIDSETIRLDRLVAKQAGITAMINGQGQLATGQGKLSGSWIGTIGTQGHHEGTYELTIDSPRTGRKDMRLTAQSTGKFGPRHWEGTVELVGHGDEWTHSQWLLKLPETVIQEEGEKYVVDESKATIAVAWPDIELTGIAYEAVEELAASGHFNASTKEWAAQLDAKDIRVQGLDDTLNLRMNSKGTDKLITVESFDVGSTRMAASGTIGYVLTDGTLRDTQVKLNWQEELAADVKNVQAASQWTVDTKLTGRVWPETDLKLLTDWQGSNVLVGQTRIPEIKAASEGRLTTKGFTAVTETFDLLGGLCKAGGQYDFGQNKVDVNLQIDQLRLQKAASLVNSPAPWEGVLSTELKLDVPIHDIQAMRGTGSWKGRDLKLWPIKASSGEGSLAIGRGKVAFDSILLEEGFGQIEGDMFFELAAAHKLYIDVRSRSWPMAFAYKDSWKEKGWVLDAGVLADMAGAYEGVGFKTNGQVDLVVDMLAKSAQGHGQLTSNVFVDGSLIGPVEMDIQMTDRTATINTIRFDGLSGFAEGAGWVDLDHPESSRVDLCCEEIDLGQLSDYFEAAQGLTGMMSGELVVEKSREAIPLEPMNYRVAVRVTNGLYRGATIRRGRFDGYLGKDRILLDSCELEILGGVIDCWARTSKHADTRYHHLIANMNQLDLNQILQMCSEKAEPVKGDVSGKLTLLTGSSLSDMTGNADLYLTNSDLANNGIVGTLYNVLNLKLFASDPVGAGRIQIRAEHKSIQLTSVEYFNRGVEVRGQGIIHDITQGTASPIEGYAIGSARPLKGIGLPGIAELDDLMKSLQSSVASVKIDGTAGDVKVHVVAFPEISNALRKLLWGQLRE